MPYYNITYHALMTITVKAPSEDEALVEASIRAYRVGEDDILPDVYIATIPEQDPEIEEDDYLNDRDPGDEHR